MLSPILDLFGILMYDLHEILWLLPSHLIKGWMVIQNVVVFYPNQGTPIVTFLVSPTRFAKLVSLRSGGRCLTSCADLEAW